MADLGRCPITGATSKVSGDQTLYGFFIGNLINKMYKLIQIKVFFSFILTVGLSSCYPQSNSIEDDIQKALQDFYKGNWASLVGMLNADTKAQIPKIILDEKTFEIEKDYVIHFLEKKSIDVDVFQVTFLVNEDTLDLIARENSQKPFLELNERKMIELLKHEHKIRYDISRYLNSQNDFFSATIWVTGVYGKKNEADSATIANQNRLDRSIYYKSRGRWDELLQIYKEEAVSGSIDAMLELGSAYDAYQPFYTYPKDYKEGEALKWYVMAAESGNDLAMLRVAYIYENGTNGIAVNYEKALDWYHKTYNIYPVGSILKLHEFYKEGKGCKKDKKLATQYLEEAFTIAETNSQMASRIGTSYKSGKHGLKKDIKKAIYWYEKAVELGNTMVSHYLYHLKDELENR